MGRRAGWGHQGSLWCLVRSVDVSRGDEVSPKNMFQVLWHFSEGAASWAEGCLFVLQGRASINPPPHPSLPPWIPLPKGMCYWPLLLELGLLASLKLMCLPLSVLLDYVFSDRRKNLETSYPLLWAAGTEKLDGHKSSLQLWVFLDVLITFRGLGPVLGTCGEEEVG